MVEVEVEVRVEDEVEGLQWPSLPALGRRQGQGGGSSAGLSTHERMLCGWVRTTANTSHTHIHTYTQSMHGAGQASCKVSAMQLEISQKKQCLKCPKYDKLYSTTFLSRLKLFMCNHNLHSAAY